MSQPIFRLTVTPFKQLTLRSYYVNLLHERLASSLQSVSIFHVFPDIFYYYPGKISLFLLATRFTYLKLTIIQNVLYHYVLG